MLTYDEYCNMNLHFKNKYENETVKNITRIHPLKQKNVIDICVNTEIIDFCMEIIVFGSASSMKCNICSDLDIMVKLKEDTLENRNKVSNEIGILTNWNYDIIYYNDLEDNKIREEIDSKGVLVWAS